MFCVVVQLEEELNFKCLLCERRLVLKGRAERGILKRIRMGWGGIDDLEDEEGAKKRDRDRQGERSAQAFTL